MEIATGLKYEMEADWIINMLCNFHCTYCSYRADSEQWGVLSYLPQVYADYFNKTKKTWMLHMSGGEPFAYNKAVDVMEAVSDKHYLSFNTNGSQTERYKRFCARIAPSRVQYFHVGVHFLERTRQNGWKELSYNMNMLRDMGYVVFGSQVMEKSVFPFFKELSKMVYEETGCILIPKTESHLTDANAYTDNEKEQLQGFVRNIVEKHGYISQYYTVNPLVDITFISGFPDFRGPKCNAGVKFVKIDEYGNVWRCEKKEHLGSIGEGTLNLHDKAYPCQEQFCPYYCLKYSTKLKQEIV